MDHVSLCLGLRVARLAEIVLLPIMASEQTQKAPDHRSAETSSSAEAIKVSIKKNQSYVPFSRALQHTWAGTGSRKLKKLTPVVYAILGE